MNGIQNTRNQDFEKSFPGCLGRVVNLFDLSPGVAGNRLLMDKPHRDGPPHSRSRSDVGVMSHSGNHIEDKMMSPEFRRYSSDKKSSGTPIKMLIAQEMSKELASKQNPPSVVAKLMGLDTLPHQQTNSVTQRSHSKGYSRSHSGIPLSYWQQEDGLDNMHMQNEFLAYPRQEEYKDVYEIWQHPGTEDCIGDKSPCRGRHHGSLGDKNMDLVRQKFLEAKRLSTDGKLRKSKQFQDALEVLCSNRDLLVNFLQEQNPILSQHLYNLHTVPPPEKKRITVLKPSKMADNSKFSGSGKKHENQTKQDSYMGQVNGLDRIHLAFPPPADGWKIDESHAQPTRIVVLKPSPVQPREAKAVGSPPSASPRISHDEEFFEELEDSEVQESREVAKAITQHMRENLSGHRRDETLLSSVFSNGYIGDESSFNKSEHEYAAGNLSDSEVVSPASRHSWDYINRFDSPYSSSSFSRASYSPESSVCREAKKRLSERFAMISSNGSYQEQRHVRRSSSTLGEMLALSDTNKGRKLEEECSKQEEPRLSNLMTDLNKDEGMDSSPRNLLRSKSLPVTSTVSRASLNVDIPGNEVHKAEVANEATKSRSGKSSLKVRVSSLFFSRNKKPSKEFSNSQPRGESCSGGSPSSLPGGRCNYENDNLDATGCDCLSPSQCKSSSRAHVSNLTGKQTLDPSEARPPVTKSGASGNHGENQDQPSPISVLEPPFEEDEFGRPGSLSNIKSDLHGHFPLQSIKSNLIDKSPPIGSIARTLSWDDSCVVSATSYPLRQSFSPPGVEEVKEEWLFFVQTLLSVAGLDGEVKSDSFLARWHSPESPLDPSLRDKYVDLNEKEILHEAKRRQKRSTRKLVFDCVNAALVEIGGYGSDSCQRAIPCSGAQNIFTEGESFMMVDQVWALMKEWFSSEVRCISGENGDNNSLVVETVVRKEVVGKGWAEHLRLEMDNLGKEIEGKLLEELVQESVNELIGGV